MKYAFVFTVCLAAVTAAPLSNVLEEAVTVKTRGEDVSLAAHEWKEKKTRGDEAIDVSGYNWKEKKTRGEDVSLAAHEWKEKKARGDEAIDVSGYNW
ncbi:hypothetical protein BKA64DRAFT_711670 [Cadophora sp. MPI-SDFR-AT-0126]|nr:hypothetical protein BKA64DRAFT_711670 [Leotiomycetes sp. MPI-SDFR-AT-0126]